MVTRTDDMKRVRDQMQDDITEVGRIAHRAKGRLEALDKANEAAQRKAVRPRGQGVRDAACGVCFPRRAEADVRV